ncbi:MAG: hypothetical protein JWQ10_2073 [Herbaspirillum sp.]|nr:hypothetical protein [Herbaspirillum sp.]
MFAEIKKVIHDCATGPDGVTYNPVRIIGYSSCVAAIGVFLYAGIVALQALKFPWTEFASGFCLLMGGLFAVGSAEAVKGAFKTEPPHTDPAKGEK